MDVPHVALVGAAVFAAGAVNAIAGGGSLLSFPTLVAMGLPSVTASLTNTVALCPGYFGAAYMQRRDLIGQGRRVAQLVVVGAIGGAAGAQLLLSTGAGAYDVIVPFLLLFSVTLLAFQDRLRAFVVARGLGPDRLDDHAGDGGCRARRWRARRRDRVAGAVYFAKI